MVICITLNSTNDELAFGISWSPCKLKSKSDLEDGQVLCLPDHGGGRGGERVPGRVFHGRSQRGSQGNSSRSDGPGSTGGLFQEVGFTVYGLGSGVWGLGFGFFVPVLDNQFFNLGFGPA